MKFTIGLIIALIMLGVCVATVAYNVRKELGPHPSRKKTQGDRCAKAG